MTGRAAEPDAKKFSLRHPAVVLAVIASCRLLPAGRASCYCCCCCCLAGAPPRPPSPHVPCRQIRALLITSPEPLGVSDPPSPSEPSETPTFLGALSQSHRPPPFPVRALGGALASLQDELRSRFGSILLGGRARGRMERLADALTGSPVRRSGEALLADLFGDDGRKAGNGSPLPLALRLPASGTGAAGVRTGATSSSALPPLLAILPSTILDGQSSGVLYEASLPAGRHHKTAGRHHKQRR